VAEGCFCLPGTWCSEAPLGIRWFHKRPSGMELCGGRPSSLPESAAPARQVRRGPAAQLAAQLRSIYVAPAIVRSSTCNTKSMQLHRRPKQKAQHFDAGFERPDSPTDNFATIIATLSIRLSPGSDYITVKTNTPFREMLYLFWV